MFSKYEVYTDCGSIYCYKDTNILRNSLNLRDYETLKHAEADITAVKQQALQLRPITGRFTSHHLCQIHRFLFEDIYPFAGHFRRENIRKGDTAFLNFMEVPQKLSSLLEKLRQENLLRHLNEAEMVTRLAYYFAELNYIHPFREGNGRSTREFIRELLFINGFEVNWSEVAVDELLDAMIASVYDSSGLESVLKRCISKQ